MRLLLPIPPLDTHSLRAANGAVFLGSNTNAWHAVLATVWPKPTAVCIKAVTGTQTYDPGSIDISIDQGNGAGYQRNRAVYGTYQRSNSTVVEKCYSQIKGVRVQAKNIDEWIGSITFSTDGGSTYTAGTCATCNKNPGGSTDRMKVGFNNDNDSSVSSLTHACEPIA